MAWNDGLQGQVLLIAATQNSPLCVVAGPGTGKTFALMRRLARLLEVDDVTPSRVLACTFTRAAAKDITQAVGLLGVDGADEIVTQTVHGFCFSMLSRQDVLEATGRIPRPLLRFEERFLLQDLGVAGLEGIRDCSKRLRAFSAAWARLQHDEPGWPEDEDDQRFHNCLVAWLRFHEAMLIGELIPEGIKYLRLNPHSPYRTAFDHVMVDEYQDLNRAEQELIELIANGSLVVIGDEDQSIYSFKHAHPEGIVEFPDTHVDTEEASLDICRRCPKKVVAIANALIQNNITRSTRQLVAHDENPDGDIHVVQWRTMQDEADGIATFVQAQIAAESVIAGNVLVLAPRREFGYLVRDALVDRGVSAHSFFSEELLAGDPKNLDTSRSQQALALLVLLANPEDRVALRCWCGFGNNTLGGNAWRRLREHCEGSGESPWTVLERLASGDLTLSYTHILRDRFRLLRQELERLEGLSGQELIDAVFPPDEEWADQLADIARASTDDDCGAAELADTIHRNVTQPELPTHVDYVRVMSLHKSKGLTGDLVVVCGCLEGLVPPIDDALTAEEQQQVVDEHRRLFYVAVTRTRKMLVLSSVTGIQVALAFRMRARTTRSVNGIASTVTSRFVHELGPECPAGITGEAFLESTTGHDQ